MLRFTSLASGSGGNATLIEGTVDGQAPTRLLVDCGLAPRRLAAALARRGLSSADVDAVFVTHEHSDHVGGVIALQRRHGTAVWASAGTWSAACRGHNGSHAAPARVAAHAQDIVIGALTLSPFAVPHDAAEPLQLVVRQGAHRVGIVTDLGEPTAAVARALNGCDALVLECNHDRERLANGPYPAWLKRRIGGARGHLANEQSAALLDACRHDGLRHVIAAHLSRQNNEPALALAALRGALAAGLGFGTPSLHVAGPDDGCDWITLD